MGGRNTVVSIKDPLTVSVSNTIDVNCKRDKDNNIVSIDIPGLSKISIGDKLTISTRKFPYKINKIVSRDIMGLPVYDLMIAPRTKASLFILPMLPGTRSSYFYDKFLLNCFVGTTKIKNVIVLLFRFSGIKSFVSLEESMKKLKTFLSVEDPTKSTVLYVFNIPKHYQKDFNKFLEGKYSEMDTKYKFRILNFHGVGEESILGQILFKDPYRKMELEDLLGSDLPENAELYSIPNMEQEIYDPDKYDL